MLAVPDDAWHKSSRSSGAQNCVEVAHGPSWTAVRHSKHPTGPMLVFTDGEWAAFVQGVKLEEFDRYDH
jgi:hypothetical protein